MNPVNSIETQKVLLEKFFIGVTGAIPAYILEEMTARHSDHTLRHIDVFTELSHAAEQMLIHMRSYVLKGMKEEKEKVEFTYPATWFDHLKNDWLKSGVKWKIKVASKFSPPQYTTWSREVKTIRVCPHDDSYLSENYKHIEYLWRGTL